MVHVLRSELLRLRRPSLIGSWLGLTGMFAVLINTAMFQFVADGQTEGGPGATFPTLDELIAPTGLVAGLGAAATVFGVVTLAFWAMTAATDYQTGLIRLLASTEPSRWRLLGGKALALALWTAAATLLALVLCVLVAPIAAEGAGVSTDAWRDISAGDVGLAWLHLYAACLVWGAVGLALATITRSAAVAISVGVGYVLVVEAVVSAIVSDLGDWLPGSTLTALAQGGTAEVSVGAAAALGLFYGVGGLLTAGIVQRRRDVTD